MTFLLDTNVLIYSLDPRDPGKRERARDLLERLVALGSGRLPAQALAEFANVSLRKLHLAPDWAYRQVERLEVLFPTYPTTSSVVLEALRGVRDHGMSYYDAQIWAAAKLNQVPVVLSEDFAKGATVEGVAFLNPFDSDFALDALG